MSDVSLSNNGLFSSSLTGGGNFLNPGTDILRVSSMTADFGTAFNLDARGGVGGMASCTNSLMMRYEVFHRMSQIRYDTYAASNSSMSESSM